jgi:putative inorganic carbon (HCO3(-)) transporter
MDRRDSQTVLFQSAPKVTWRHVGMVALALSAIACGLALLFIPGKYQLIVVFAIPAIAIVVLILLNPYVGVFIYLLFEYLRPYDLVPALVYLKIPLIVIIVTAASFVLRLARSKKMIWSNFGWFYFGFVVLIGFTVFSAENYFYALQVFRVMFGFFVMFIVCVNVVDNYDRMRKLIWLMLAIHLFFSLKGIYNYVYSIAPSGDQQTSGVIGSSFLADENDFALALNIMVPFAYFGVIYSKRLYSKVLAFIVLTSLVLGVVASFSRGGWVGLLAALGFCFLRTRRRIVSFAFAVLFLIVLDSVAPRSYWKEISTITDTEETTAVTRLHYWKAAVRMYLDYPIVGVGANNGGVHMPDYVTGFADPATQWGRAFHGTLPQVLAELGTIGIVLYLAMIIIAFRYLLKIRRDALKSGDRTEIVNYSDSIFGGIIAYLATATFLSTAYYPQLWTLFALTMILVRCPRRISEANRDLNDRATEPAQPISSS